MSHIEYQLGLARRDDLLREAADRRRAQELKSGLDRPGSAASSPSLGLITRRLHRAPSTTGPHRAARA
jgi:hypothetical protein